MDAMCTFMYLFVVYFSFAPVISASIYRYVNSSDIQVLMMATETKTLTSTIWPRLASRQFLSFPIVQTLLPVTFGYSLSSETAVMRQLRRWKRLWRRSLTRSHKRTSMGPCRCCWNSTTSALQPEEITSKRTSVSWVYFQ